jgi:hypothetical protein
MGIMGFLTGEHRQTLEVDFIRPVEKLIDEHVSRTRKFVLVIALRIADVTQRRYGQRQNCYLPVRVHAHVIV